MAKELPFFKFYPAEWVMGDITMCSMEAQGLFINLCAFYWMKGCSICLAKAKQRFSKDVAPLNELLEIGIISVDENENLIIKFLDEQMNEFIDVSEKRSIAGKMGGKAKAKQLPEFAKAKDSYIEIEVEEDKEIDKDKIKSKSKRTPAKKSNAIDIEQARAYYRQLWYDARDTAPDAIGWVEAIGKTIKDDNLDAVLCMPDPIRLSDVIIWRKQYDIEDLKQILREMENSNLLHKYKSCRLTANNWLKRQSK